MKNPWLSAWLSGANAWSGAGRGLWSAEMQRQQTAATQQMTKQMMEFWSPFVAPPAVTAAPKPRRARRKSR